MPLLWCQLIALNYNSLLVIESVTKETKPSPQYFGNSTTSLNRVWQRFVVLKVWDFREGLGFPFYFGMLISDQILVYNNSKEGKILWRCVSFAMLSGERQSKMLFCCAFFVRSPKREPASMSSFSFLQQLDFQNAFLHLWEL